MISFLHTLTSVIFGLDILDRFTLKKNSIFLKCGELAADQDLKTSFSWLKSNGESLGIKARGLRGREFPEKKASQC